MKHTISCSAQAAEQAQAAAPSTSVSCLFSSQPGAIAKTERQLQLLKNSAQQKDTHSAWAVGKFLVSQHQTSSTHFTEAVTCPWALVLSQGNCSTPPQLDKVFSLMKAVVRWELSRMSAGGRMKSHTTVSLASSFPHLPFTTMGFSLHFTAEAEICWTLAGVDDLSFVWDCCPWWWHSGVLFLAINCLWNLSLSLISCTFCQLVMTILMVIIELISLLSLLSQALNFYEKYRLDKTSFACSDENAHKSESRLLSTSLFSHC